jgi:hypothetical protein
LTFADLTGDEKMKTDEQQIKEILDRPHKPSECPSKGMFGRNCKNCKEALVNISPSMYAILKQLQVGKTTAYGYTMDTNGPTRINASSVRGLIRRGLLERCGTMPLQTVNFDGQEYGHRTAVYKISEKGREILLDAGEAVQIEVEPFQIAPQLVQTAIDLQHKARFEEWKRSLLF